VSIAWERALEECEARLDAAGTALEAGAPVTVAPFAPPETDEPMPAALADRARDLVARSVELEGLLARELDGIRAELRRLPRMPAAPRETRFDAQA